MALSTRNYNSTLLGGGKLANNENSTTTFPGKVGLGTRQSQRSVLSNRTNDTTVSTRNHEKKGLAQKEVTKPTRGLTKSRATTSLKNEVDKPTIKAPSPMEVSPAEMSRVNVEDIDTADSDNPQLVAQYVGDIYNYLRKLEREQAVRADYMKDYAINARMRGILVDWLVQVHSRFHLLQETLYLTVAIIDRFLQEQEVSRTKLQLVGVTAMLIASKYEEMYAPEIADFVYITDNAYTKAEIMRLECVILKTLKFNLGKPLPLHFLRRNSKAGQVDSTVHTLAKYLMELTLTDYNCVQFHPSQIGAAVLCLSMKVMSPEQTWTESLNFYSAYNEDDLMPVIKRICQLILKSENSKLQAIKTKYQSSKFMKICTIGELQSDIIEELAHYDS